MIPTDILYAGTGYNPLDGYDSLFLAIFWARIDLNRTPYKKEVRDAFRILSRIDFKVMTMRGQQDWMGV